MKKGDLPLLDKKYPYCRPTCKCVDMSGNMMMYMEGNTIENMTVLMSDGTSSTPSLILINIFWINPIGALSYVGPAAFSNAVTSLDQPPGGLIWKVNSPVGSLGPIQLNFNPNGGTNTGAIAIDNLNHLIVSQSNGAMFTFEAVSGGYYIRSGDLYARINPGSSSSDLDMIADRSKAQLFGIDTMQ